FAGLEKHGAKVLKYNSSEEFASSLWKIASPVAIEGKAAADTSFICNEVKADKKNEVSEDNSESAAEIQAWFQKIIDSPDSDVKARKIQNWYRSALNRSRKYPRNKTLDKIYHKIYNDMSDHYGDVKDALESLSMTEKTAQHEKADIEWLESELRQTNDIIHSVSEWID
ncbi:12487_t:CDS:2, partial [Racocetra fulgida]